jgi:hypothetical protein
MQFKPTKANCFEVFLDDLHKILWFKTLKQTTINYSIFQLQEFKNWLRRAQIRPQHVHDMSTRTWLFLCKPVLVMNITEILLTWCFITINHPLCIVQKVTLLPLTHTPTIKSYLLYKNVKVGLLKSHWTFPN